MDTTAAQVAAAPDRPARQPNRLLALLERYSPSQGWPTLVMLALVLYSVGSSVSSANWVETPGIYRVLTIAAVAGLLLAKLRAPAAALHLAGLGIGAVVVTWQTSSLIAGEPLPQQVYDFWRRLGEWYTAATTGGISTDLLPFTLLLLTAAWLLGYVSSWFIFRSSNVWVGVVLASTAILTNLSFLPGRFIVQFFVFMFFTMILVVRVSVVQRHDVWRRAGLRFNPLAGWMTIHAAVWLCVIAMIVAAFVPMRVFVSSGLSDAWDVGRTPVAYLEDEFGRLFGAVPSRKDLAGRIFGATLPFLGEISLDGDVVMWTKTKYPSYWASRTYSEYTSRGWVAGDTSEVAVDPDTLSPMTADSTKRESIEQNIQLSFETTSLMAGGSLDWVSRDAVVETLSPKIFRIDMSDPSAEADYPEDIRLLAAELRGLPDQPAGEPLGPVVAQMIPDDLTLVEVTGDETVPDRTSLAAVTLQRKIPLAPDVAAMRFATEVRENEPYTVLASVSVAEPEDLAEADTEYYGFITDHYLQLPDSLPQRVRDLAAELTDGVGNPYGKARAIQAYLRGDDFTYSQEIDAPPSSSDGVDHFLFETQTGYSDYFASAMAVMLRASGVPARLTAGYAPGELDPNSGQYFIRDTDSHAWVQVYFPDYGWIDFEPTPAWDLPGRDTAPTVDTGGGTTTTQLGIEDAHDIFPAEDPFMEELNPFGGSDLTLERSYDSLIRAGIGAASAAALALALYLLWNQGLWGKDQAVKAYSKMGRLGVLAGLPRRRQQTPGEYAASIGRSVPEAAEGAEHITTAFSRRRYGAREDDEEADEAVERAWRDIRWSLARQTLRRLLRMGGGRTR